MARQPKFQSSAKPVDSTAEDGSGDDDILKEAKDAFDTAVEAELHNREEALDDIRFARLADQWPSRERKAREDEGRPVLTINVLPPIIRQVVNDARRNKPAISIHPADSKADPHTAEIMSGLIRNIEYQSNADIAYDTALECAVTSGFGFWRINTAYSSDDTFEQDIRIGAIPNPFSVYGDPYSTAADSRDWNSAFIVDMMPKARFEQLYKGAAPVDWEEAQGYSVLQAPWLEDDRIRVAEYWKREPSIRKIVALAVPGEDSPRVVGLDEYENNKDAFDAMGAQVVGSPRSVTSHKVTQYLMTGKEVLSTTPWAGIYIPIVPVYGDEVNLEGVRHLRSLVRDAKDPARMMNYWRTMATELVALAPKAPFVGPVGAFETDRSKWETANSTAHAYIEYDGATTPQRQPFAGVPAGALQEALSASDDIKRITGIYNPALGAASNEVSGVAINARKVESDTSNFNYIDNLTRSIRHGGRIFIDLIPKVYSTARVVRVLGIDKTTKIVPINQPIPGPMPPVPGAAPGASPGMAPGAPMAPANDAGDVTHIFDLGAGKYDLTVEAGPGFTTQREQAASQMMELAQAYPAIIPLIGDLIAKNLDWPGADELADRLRSMLPPQAQGGEGGAPPGAPSPPQGPQGMPPEAVEIASQAHEAITGLQGENEQLKQQLAAALQDQANRQRELEIKAQEADTKQQQADTDRLEAVHKLIQPTLVPNGGDGRTVGGDARPGRVG